MPLAVAVIQAALLDDVHAHVDWVPTIIEPVLADASTVTLVGDNVTVHGGAGCVTVKLLPATVTTAER